MTRPKVVTLVTGRVQPDRIAEVTDPYREGLKNGPPPDLEETFLLTGDAGQVAILSVWHRRADLDAMLASGEEPFIASRHPQRRGHSRGFDLRNRYPGDERSRLIGPNRTRADWSCWPDGPTDLWDAADSTYGDAAG